MTRQEIDNLTADEHALLWELYVLECEASRLHGSLSDFDVWLQERD